MQRNKRDERLAAVRGRRVVVCLGVVAAVMCAGAAWAQEGATARVTADRLNFRESCGMEAPVQGVLTAGAEIELLGEPLGEDSWVRVRDESGQEGCVSARYIDVTGEPALAPPDVPEGSYGEEMEAGAAESEAGEMESYENPEATADARQEVETLDRQADRDWSAERERTVRGFIDLSYGAAWAASEDEEWQTLIDPNAGGGVTDDRITYHMPRGEAFSIGGGVLFGPGLGVGIRLSQQTHEDPADLRLFSTFAGPPFQVEARARTEPDLEREEQAAHVSFVYAPLQGDAFLLRLFVGPSYFDVTQDTVDDIFVTETPFEIVGFVRGEQDDTAIGFHLGADASWYWGRWGVGLAAYYSRGEVEFRDKYFEGAGPTTESSVREVDVGGTQLMGGLRVRF